MVSIDVIFTSTDHTKQLNPWPNSSASRVVSYSQLSACQGDMQPFQGDPSTHGRLTSLRNKPQQKQPRQLSASILAWIVSQCIQLLFDGQKCVLLLRAWKASFLKSSHIWIISVNYWKLPCCYKYFDYGIWLQTVWITKCSNNQGPDNRGTTVIQCRTLNVETFYSSQH